jgi:peroxiredoxin family protein
MDLLLICRDAVASSLLSNLILAIEAHKSGKEVVILFTQEALSALINGTFLWPKGLHGQRTRLTMADNASDFNIPVMLRGEGRQINAMGIIENAIKIGIPMYACPLWAKLLDLKGKLPEGIKEMDFETAINALFNAKKIIGSF